MKTDSQDPAEGREGTQTEDNVVRFPREWLGPREDLVQIGVPDAAATAPPAPDDFWGDGSSDLQSALVGPTVKDDDSGQADAAPAGSPPRPRDLGRSWPARTPALIAAATAVLILAVVVLSALGGRRSVPPHPQVASISRSRGTSANGSRPALGARMTDARHVSLKPARGRRVHGPARRRPHPTKTKRAASGTSATPTLIATSSSSNPSTAYSSVTSTSSQTVSNTPAQAASVQPSQPAFGANGSLGPGRGAANTQ